MNQGELDVVKKEMASLNTNILGISELKWTRMGELNSDDHFIYYRGQESPRRNDVAHIVNKRVQNAVLRYVYMMDHISIGLVIQSCQTLCDCKDCSPPGSSTEGILQARILEWVAISFSRRSSKPRDWIQGSCIAGRLFTDWVSKMQYLGVISKSTEWSWFTSKANHSHHSNPSLYPNH